MATTGTACRLPAGPPQALPAEPPPLGERQGSCSPCPGLPSAGTRTESKRRNAESKAGQADGEEATRWLLPPFLYRQRFHTGCCQKPLPFYKGITRFLPSQVNQIHSYWSGLHSCKCSVFQGQLVTAIISIIFRERSTFFPILLFLRCFKGKGGINEHFLLVGIV